jgi:hypothetical protein
MSERITAKNLEAIAERINKMTNSPTETYVKDAAGKYIAQIGNYHMSYAYGGAALMRICTNGGGCEDVLRIGHTSKRDMYQAMHAFISGLEHATEPGYYANAKRITA